MNTGIIMIGLALVMLSIGLITSPANAAGPDTSFSPGCGSVFVPAGTGAGGVPGSSVLPDTAATTGTVTDDTPGSGYLLSATHL